MMRELLRSRLLPRVILTLLFSSASILHAQDYRAKVQGTVNDSSGAVIAGSQVTLSNVKTGISTVKTTNDAGQYIFDFVEPGTYTLIAEQTGFGKFQQENFTVQVRADVTINPVLSAGGVAEQVTVAQEVVAVKFNTSGVDLTIIEKCSPTFRFLDETRSGWLCSILQSLTAAGAPTTRSTCGGLKPSMSAAARMGKSTFCSTGRRLA